jgi:hypothetical protein
VRRGRLRTENRAAVLGFVSVRSVDSDWFGPTAGSDRFAFTAWLGVRAGRLAWLGGDSGIVGVRRVRQRAGETWLAGSRQLDRRDRPVRLQGVRTARCDGVGGRGLAGADIVFGADIASGAGAGAIGRDVPTGRRYIGCHDGLRRLAAGDHGSGGDRRRETLGRGWTPATGPLAGAGLGPASWLRMGDGLLATGATSPSLTIAVIPRMPPPASAKHAAAAALAARVFDRSDAAVRRRWLAATVRKWGSAPIHAIKALAGGPEPALRRWRAVSSGTLGLRVRQPHLTYVDTPR